MSYSSFFALGAAVFAAAFGYGAVMPLLPELLTPLLPGAGPVALSWHAGAFAGIYMLSVVVFSPAWGAASDRYGTKPILLLGLAGSALAVFALAFAGGLWSAYLGRAVQGAFASALLPVATSALAPIPDTAERARKVAGLGADVTANNDNDRALLKRFSLFGPPGIVFFDAHGREIRGLRVIGYQDAERFLKTLSLAAAP
jgi:predicted MFS family arabinose efflux permease